MLENIRDRGAKKWTTMMLSEHLVELRKWLKEDNNEERPELNDFDLEAIKEEMEVAYKRKCLTFVKSWGNGEIILHSGVMKEIDVDSMCITIYGPFGKDRILVKDIIGVRCEE
ncbi:YolD-like family protein [Sporosarcina sp. resist]|uniref:YolD-like family protein n=1 Tax=Sporosarcina sp. resist TaxID=2762563 RepID=UPI00164DD84F|nr:YolD-like family protein [Sporosarcina sp. resist]QNK87725.1 YolD-like family protein [Sporosarcina sp. resist]